MYSLDEIGDILDSIVDSLPLEVYKDLNGGVLLLPEAKIHPESAGEDLFILGEYHADWPMGKYIIIYFGSVMQIYGHLSLAKLKEKLTDILWHEMTHHWEFLAGEKGLEIKDEIEMEQYRRNQQSKS